MFSFIHFNKIQHEIRLVRWIFNIYMFNFRFDFVAFHSFKCLYCTVSWVFSQVMSGISFRCLIYVLNSIRDVNIFVHCGPPGQRWTTIHSFIYSLLLYTQASVRGNEIWYNCCSRLHGGLVWLRKYSHI